MQSSLFPPAGWDTTADCAYGMQNISMDLVLWFRQAML